MKTHTLKDVQRLQIIVTVEGFTMILETARQRVLLERMTDRDLETFQRTIEQARRTNPTAHISA